MMKISFPIPMLALLAFGSLALSLPCPAEETASSHTFRVLGLFQPDRVDDLRETVASMPDFELADVEFESGEATFRFDAVALFGRNKTPDQIAENFSQRLRQISNGTFEALPVSAFPQEKQVEVKIPIAGLDCKGCSYGAYLAVHKLDGVERATASFRDGFVIAWIDPDKTNRAALEEALTNRRVTLRGTKKIGIDDEPMLDPEAMAESYWHLVAQDRSSWTFRARPEAEAQKLSSSEAANGEPRLWGVSRSSWMTPSRCSLLAS